MKYTLALLAVLTLTVAAKADTINHIDATADIYGLQSFHAGFDWDVTTQTTVPQSQFDGSATGPIPFDSWAFGTIWENFASWGGTGWGTGSRSTFGNFGAAGICSRLTT